MHKYAILNRPELSGLASTKLNLLHVVRRYGPVGGMERYVWELTLQLQKLGHNVTVICEHCHVDKPEGISVVELGEIAQRPRWLSALRFDQHVASWLAANPQAEFLIHSHERISSHHITTFHASPFATVFEKPWWRLISLRVAMQIYLERRELKNARCIVPNSHFLKKQLTHYYPEFAHKLSEPVMPGISSGIQRIQRNISIYGGTIGFVGKEWKRKGLSKAVEIVKKLRLTRPNLIFIVVGPEIKEVQHLFADWKDGYILKGWSDQAPYTDFDVLLHPANSEPYGMVISEAMAAKVPVVISDVCGAAVHVTSSAGNVLSLNESIDDWIKAVECQLSRTEDVLQFERSWLKVAQEYENRWNALDVSCNQDENPELSLNGISFIQ